MLGYRANAYHIRLGFQLSIECPSKPSKLNQAELEIVVMTPTAMAKAANTVWLAPVEEIVRFYVEAHEELRGTQLEHDFL